MVCVPVSTGIECCRWKMAEQKQETRVYKTDHGINGARRVVSHNDVRCLCVQHVVD